MKTASAFFNDYKREFFIIFLTSLSLIVFVPIFTYAYFSHDLISKESIMNRNDTGVILLDRDNKPFFTFYQAKYKSFTKLSKIPKRVRQAIIASEDKNFYDHSGFSFPSLVRALITNLRKKEILYGGSTITQQLVKNALLNSNKNYLRKIQEIVLAQEIERRYTKDEILEMYLNSVYFGEGSFGVENAAITYFGKHIQDLTLSEQAFLTAILPSPSALSPFTGDFQQAKVRQKIVLGKMFEEKYITKKEKIRAENQQITFHPALTDVNASAPHFALMVLDELKKQFGEERVSRSGLEVKTTLDRKLQSFAEKAVADQVEKLRGNIVSNGAAVVMDPKTGDVKALVGSTDWFNEKFGKVNLATAPRSVGSSFKPIVYAAAFEKGLITPATVLRDEPTTFPGGYSPKDYDRKFRGRVLVRRALANSLNVPAVEVMQKVGLDNALEMAERLGITTLKEPSNYGLSLVLGAGEVRLLDLTNVYATFANQGIRTKPRLILEVYDKQKRKIYASSIKRQKAVDPEIAFLISSILSDDKARAEVFSNLLTISRPAAVKTGTAEAYKDALTLGYTPSLAVGVWVGNNDNTPMDSVAGSLGAAPIWKNIMEYSLAESAVEAFHPPVGIVQLPICGNGGVLIASNNRFSYANTEYFIKGKQPYTYCSQIYPTWNPNVLSTDKKNGELKDVRKN